MIKKIILLGVILITTICLTGCSLKNKIKSVTTQNNNNIDEKALLSSTADIDLHDIDGNKTNYVFTYKNTQFSAKYTKDNWHINDSYKITNQKDLEIICQALIDVHPIHGKDMKSYRTVDDLVYEWQQHNLAYSILPDDNVWKEHAKNVDLDPEDQGRSLEELYEARTGSKLDVNKLKNNSKVQKIKNKVKQLVN